jgi:hypothetical protein
MHAGMAPNHLHDMTLGGALGAEVFGQSRNMTPMPVSRRSTSLLWMTDESLYLRRVWCVRVGLPRADGALLQGHRTLNQLPLPQGELIEQCISMPLLCCTHGMLPRLRPLSLHGVERSAVCLPGTNVLTLILTCTSPVTMSYRFLAR